MRRHLAAALLLLLSACAPAPPQGGPVPPVPAEPLSAAAGDALDAVFASPLDIDPATVAELERTADPRAAWPLVDLLRFHQAQTHGPAIADALQSLTGHVPDAYEGAWVDFSNVLLRADVPAPDGYLAWKRAIFVAVHDRFAPFFDDASPLDWRQVSWGGVLRDGIPSLDDPPMVPARDGSWLPESDVVFGVVVDGQARAYPRRVMEVHEMVNATIAGRRIAVPYCTLCGTAVAYFTDTIDGRDEPLELRTSGLLQRSNKLMYDARTESLFDQFRGTAVSGPLLQARVRLDRAPLVVTTWTQWRAAHPDTLITAEEIRGRTYGPDPLAGRDDDGPIFPVGEVDGRLPVMTVVYGVVTPDGTPVAFPSKTARGALEAGRAVSAHGVTLAVEAGGLVALSDGEPVDGQEAFWFAWSQFRPDTEVWSG